MEIVFSVCLFEQSNVPHRELASLVAVAEFRNLSNGMRNPMHGTVLIQDLHQDIRFWLGIHMTVKRFPAERAVVVIPLEVGNTGWAYPLGVPLPVHTRRRERASRLKTDVAIKHLIRLSPMLVLLYMLIYQSSADEGRLTSSTHTI